MIFLQALTREKISGAVVQKGRSKALAITDIGNELGELTECLNKRLQEAYLDMSTGRDHRRTHRGSSHRTSFIEYVSEVYNARKEVRKRNSVGTDGHGHWPHARALEAL